MKSSLERLLCFLLVLACPALSLAQSQGPDYDGLVNKGRNPTRQQVPQAAAPKPEPPVACSEQPGNFLAALTSGAGIGLARAVAINAGRFGPLGIGLAVAGTLADAYLQYTMTGEVDVARLAVHVLVAGIVASFPMTVPAAIIAGVAGGALAEFLGTISEHPIHSSGAYQSH